jgi:5-methylcytosine-specific restriction protein B
MNGSIEERQKIWDEFLKRWPLEAMGQTTLEQYTQAGNKDCFVYWLEVLTEKLGSMWGGSAFKFGIYSRKDQTPKPSEGGTSYGDGYAWATKYGDSPQSAFAAVLDEVMKVAKAARQGDLASIDAADLGVVTKWKIAFLYQNRDLPSVLPIYKLDHLRSAIGSKANMAAAEMHAQLMADRAGKNVLEYGDEIWGKVHEIQSAQLTTEAAHDFLKASSHFVEIKAATEKMAGFRSATGKEIALALDNKVPTLYLSQGPWLAGVLQELSRIIEYAADRTRSSNLAANAPTLDTGNAIVKVNVPTMAALIQVCDAYDGADGSEELNNSTTQSGAFMSNAPLNQILYGPPGTGKTYRTIEEALIILDPECFQANQDDRATLKARFDELSAAGHIRFVTFHQSFSYEDFVEGLRAVNDADGDLRYEVVDGVFKTLCDTAAVQVTKHSAPPINFDGRRIWKMSLGNTQGEDAYIYDECIENGYALLGYGNEIDFAGCLSKEDIRDRYVKHGEIVNIGDYSVGSVATFMLKMKVGDLIVVTDGNFKFRAIGEISGNYQCVLRNDQGDGYAQRRAVSWLRVYKPSLPHSQLMDNQFVQRTLYELKTRSLHSGALEGLLDSHAGGGVGVAPMPGLLTGDAIGTSYIIGKVSPDVVMVEKSGGSSVPFTWDLLNSLANLVRNKTITLDDIRNKLVFEKVPGLKLEKYLVNGYQNILHPLVERLLTRHEAGGGSSPAASRVGSPKVLIIDEINRGSVSRIFGELITLIETTKRKGNVEALEVILPYSKKPFSVPSNVYLIGTMNTADRSLSGLDIALRRRFTFVELPPRPDLLDGIVIENIRIGDLLRSMNERIEVLLDRDHRLGHAYFLPLKDQSSLIELAAIFRQQVIPLLQEYFFEDWERIRWVLNDHRKSDSSHRFISRPTNNLSELFGSEAESQLQENRWLINDAAFDLAGSYLDVIGVTA